MNPLLAQIEQLLPSIISQTTWEEAADEDRFEGYVFGLVLEAARREGAIIRMENCDSPFSGIATFRTSGACQPF